MGNELPAYRLQAEEVISIDKTALDIVYRYRYPQLYPQELQILWGFE